MRRAGKLGGGYKKRRLHELLRELGMKLYKPYILDIKRPQNTEQILEKRLNKVLRKLKRAGYKLGDIVIGFLDELSPRNSPNTARPWSFERLKLKKITTKQREKANAFGLYAINEESLLCLRKELK